MTPTVMTDHETYIKTVCGWGRKWMLSALHGRGLKQGYLKLTNRELAEVLWNFYKQAHAA